MAIKFADIQYNLRMVFMLTILICTLCFTKNAYSQEPPNLKIVDLTGSPTATVTLTDIVRTSNSFPCGSGIPNMGGSTYSPGTDDCVTFKVYLHPGSAGVFATVEGAAPQSQNWGINCEQSSPVNEIFCLDATEPYYYLTYCKNGNNANTFTFTSITRPDIYYSGECTLNCPDILQIGEGFLNYSIVSTQTDATLKKRDESYLSCYPNCSNIETSTNNTVTVTPQGNFPISAEYRITGQASSSINNPCNYEIIADTTFKINLHEILTYEITPSSGVYTCCETTSTLDLSVENIQNGIPFKDGTNDYYNITWFNGLGASGSQIDITKQGTSSTLTIDKPGDYSVQIEENNANCEPIILDFPVRSESTLPVSLLSFEAKSSNHGVLVSWKTANESSSDYFILEKSQNMIEYIKVGKIQAQGYSHFMTEYSYYDESFTPHLQYYRLIQVDFDGTETIYDPVAVYHENFRNNSGQIIVTPNPCKSELRIELVDISDHNVSLSIIDQQGKIIFIKNNLTGLFHNLEIESLSPGIYILRTETSDGIFMNKLYKL